MNRINLIYEALAFSLPPLLSLVHNSEAIHLIKERQDSYNPENRKLSSDHKAMLHSVLLTIRRGITSRSEGNSFGESKATDHQKTAAIIAMILVVLAFTIAGLILFHRPIAALLRKGHDRNADPEAQVPTTMQKPPTLPPLRFIRENSSCFPPVQLEADAQTQRESLHEPLAPGYVSLPKKAKKKTLAARRGRQVAPLVNYSKYPRIMK